MGLNASEGSTSTFKPVPVGSHAARCVAVIDLGTQTVDFQGETKYQHKVTLTFEAYAEDENGELLLDSETRPLQISKRYTLSLHERAGLRRDLNSWRGRPFTSEELQSFDLRKILGAPCMLSVAQGESNGRTYSNIAAIVAAPAAVKKGMLAQVAPSRSFDLDAPDWTVFAEIGPWLQKTIAASPEYQSLQQAGKVPADVQRAVAVALAAAQQGKPAAKQAQAVKADPMNLPKDELEDELDDVTF